MMSTHTGQMIRSKARREVAGSDCPEQGLAREVPKRALCDSGLDYHVLHEGLRRADGAGV